MKRRWLKIMIIFVALALVGILVGYFISKSKAPQPQSKPNIKYEPLTGAPFVQKPQPKQHPSYSVLGNVVGRAAQSHMGCPACLGWGFFKIYPCPTCWGHGSYILRHLKSITFGATASSGVQIVWINGIAYEYVRKEEVICSECRGRGFVVDLTSRCGTCGGVMTSQREQEAVQWARANAPAQKAVYDVVDDGTLR